MIALPPSPPAVHDNVTSVLPTVAVSPVGASGTVAAVAVIVMLNVSSSVRPSTSVAV